jgi:xanthosine utilization system XapX-like protein
MNPLAWYCKGKIVGLLGLLVGERVKKGKKSEIKKRRGKVSRCMKLGAMVALL